MRIRQWTLIDSPKTRKCLLCLPGREGSTNGMFNLIRYMRLPPIRIAVLRPRCYQWYPPPNGINDQGAAVKGIKKTLAELVSGIKALMRFWDMDTSDIMVIGYSAGAVMALQLVVTAQIKLSGCIAFAGAILDTDSVLPAIHDTPILLSHNRDDQCFSWYERYLPMREVLAKNNYNAIGYENQFGGHNISCLQLKQAREFLGHNAVGLF